MGEPEERLKYDLTDKVDLKNVYARVLNKWPHADKVAILGKKYDYPALYKISDDPYPGTGTGDVLL